MDPDNSEAEVRRMSKHKFRYPSIVHGPICFGISRIRGGGVGGVAGHGAAIFASRKMRPGFARVWQHFSHPDKMARKTFSHGKGAYEDAVCCAVLPVCEKAFRLLHRALPGTKDPVYCTGPSP